MTRREKLIRSGLNKWAKKSCKGILKYATGVGKTYAAILAIEKFSELFPEKDILIVCPTVTVIDNFKDEFKKFKKQKLLKNCKFICYASIRKEDGNDYSLVVLDEIHHITTDVKMKFFSLVTYEGILGLSASLTDTQIYDLKFYLSIVDEISLKDVENEDFISKYTIINYPIEFTKEEKQLYDEYTNAIDYAWMTFHKQSWKYINKRSRLIYSAFNKLQAAEDIVKLFPNKYGIIFSLSTDFADKIADKLGNTCVAIHSKHSKKLRRSKLRSFSDKRTKLRVVSVPKIFDEGVTIPQLSFEILLARHSKIKQQIQTLGRIVRKDIKDKHAIAIRVYVKNSIEQKWVTTSQEGFNVKNVNSYANLKDIIKQITKTQ